MLVAACEEVDMAEVLKRLPDLRKEGMIQSMLTVKIER
jgi:hypothetical protein